MVYLERFSFQSRKTKSQVQQTDRSNEAMTPPTPPLTQHLALSDNEGVGGGGGVPRNME